ncbi:hypothetical protein EV359DRAFT_67866 [Lentinula novae-zelandiae]|nr:hypothetical protein EV359DRAFT_67866 [Lentinula novae-zelandiae]
MSYRVYMPVILEELGFKVTERWFDEVETSLTEEGSVYIPQWIYFAYVRAVSTPPYRNFKHRWGIGLFLYQAFDAANGSLSLSVFQPLRSFISVFIRSSPSSINLDAYSQPYTDDEPSSEGTESEECNTAVAETTDLFLDSIFAFLQSSFGITPGFTDTLACADGFDDVAFEDDDVPPGEGELGTRRGTGEIISGSFLFDVSETGVPICLEEGQRRTLEERYGEVPGMVEARKGKYQVLILSTALTQNKREWERESQTEPAMRMRKRLRSGIGRDPGKC